MASPMATRLKCRSLRTSTVVVSVRFEALSAILLGPQDTPCNLNTDNPCSTGFVDDPDPIGGNVQVELGAEIIFPLPFLKDQRSVQVYIVLRCG